MGRKRPCRECGQWFEPNKRAGKRQRSCGRADCQQARHRRACSQWHERHPGYDRERRLRERVRRDTVVGEPLDRDPLAAVAWDAARDAVGLEVAVIVEETGKVLTDWVRDAVHAQRAEITKQLAKVLPAGARDEFAVGAGPP
ncbi:MAG: hypothetical protein RL701_1579 [Pseudomonadota bacterium]